MSSSSSSPAFPSPSASYKLSPVVVLTGASSGIGRAAAIAFAGEGADLVLAAREREALEVVAAECSEAGARVLVQPTDVTDAAAVKRLADAALERFGQIDVWINNVGVGAIGLFHQTPIDAHRRVVEANLLGHMNGAHAVLPHFRARGCGTLINMISLGGWVSSPYAAAYSASKFGLRGFSEALRAEVAQLPQVHVCDVYPTFVDTPGVTHGANYSGHRLSPPPGLVDPRRVADVLLSLSRRPRASTYIGLGARPGIWAHALAPNLMGRLMRWVTERALERAEPRPQTEGNLFAPSRGHAIDGGFMASRPSHRTAATWGIAATALGAAALAGWWAVRRRRPASY
ncbi:SDR family oxidoreductase [Variovorax sp. RA8]|uniref:SDR family oxidoreductase n=1 Tax=Variovorax sp. (strain JCM 16519 / RA8) TaxID=662548 RepID=UPI0013174BEB|nr:SDR family oxidoreductase [Variovorax sp. RA8]VTU38286.1 putative oxidoreductase [Variovorax sp. RA8]